MAITTNTFCIDGIDAHRVILETDCSKGMPSVSIIGLGDQAVLEAADRLRAAITHCGYTFPSARVIMNLAPADMKKRGAHYDLAMALTILKQSDQIAIPSLFQYGIIGELSLNGYIRPARGILPMVSEAKTLGIKKLILPAANLLEARLISGIECFGFESLKDVIRFLEEKEDYHDPVLHAHPTLESIDSLDFCDVKDQDEVIRAVTLGAAGGHNILMFGGPGCGKTMIAERIPGILPTMTEQEALEVTKIHSVKGLLADSHGLVKRRPFCAPHSNASLNALIGGGNPAQPGEISIAHNGVLFLDELPEFPRTVIESLRQPLENRKVTITRVNGTNTFPANFMLVAAMNPCPCGYYPSKKCHCSDYEIKTYRSKISGPILERIDIQKEVHTVDYFDYKNKRSSYTTAYLKEKVECAREIQKERFSNTPNVFCNAQMSSGLIDEFCKIDSKTEEILKDFSTKYMLSARVINKILRMARTCADMRKAKDISQKDLLFVLSCRDLDTKTKEELYTIDK